MEIGFSTERVEKWQRTIYSKRLHYQGGEQKHLSVDMKRPTATRFIAAAIKVGYQMQQSVAEWLSSAEAEGAMSTSVMVAAVRL